MDQLLLTSAAAHADGNAATAWDARLLFLRELARRPKTMGALCSSSAALARRLARHVPIDGTGCVVELGGGTGAITRALLERGVPSGRLTVIEKSERLALHLRKRFPKVRVVCGDAAEIGRSMEAAPPIDAIVSGLPLCSLPREAVQAIVGACAGCLPPGAVVAQFTYLLGCASPWLSAGLAKIGHETVWANLPPARVEVFRR
jgi:phospholipid N-methyltransferase